VVSWNPEFYKDRNNRSTSEVVYDTHTIEEEIMYMEKHRREMVRKMGGDKYNKVLAKLIQKKQKRGRRREKAQ
jgi:hypothetical protein